MTPILDHQKNVSTKIPMPVADMESSSSLNTVSPAETVQLVVAATNANDAGSAAGTVVYFRLTHNRVVDSSGIGIGNANDTSFAFVTGTILTTQVEFPSIDWEDLNNNWNNTRAEKMAAIGATLANGEFVLDHRHGFGIGKKATTGTSDTANYKYRANSTSGSSDITSVIPGTGATNLGKAEDAVHASGDVGVMMLGVRNDAGTALAVDGDYTPIQTDSLGRVRVTGGGTSNVDDSAFTVGTDSVVPAGMLADETATDSVDEGDVGIPRMTLNRKQIHASEFQEDTAHVTADYGTQILTVRKDTPTALAGADGDYAPLETDANGALHSNLATLISGENQTANVLHTRYNGSFARMTTAATATHKTGAGHLHAIVFNTKVATGTCTLYDNTAGSGTVIGIITFGAALLSDQGQSIIYDLNFATGLTAVTTGTMDITFIYS